MFTSQSEVSCDITYVVHHSDSGYILPIVCVKGGVNNDKHREYPMIQYGHFLGITHPLSNYQILYHHYSHSYIYLHMMDFQMYTNFRKYQVYFILIHHFRQKLPSHPKVQLFCPKTIIFTQQSFLLILTTENIGLLCSFRKIISFQRYVPKGLGICTFCCSWSFPILHSKQTQCEVDQWHTLKVSWCKLNSLQVMCHLVRLGQVKKRKAQG